MTASASLTSPRSKGWSIFAVAAVMFMSSMATFIQSFVVAKLLLLTVFLVVAAAGVAARQRVVVHPRLVSFYLLVSVAGGVWAMVGLFHSGNYVVGVFEALRLYCIWSLAFVILYTLLRSEPSLPLMHATMVAAGIGISLINLIGLVDEAGSLSLIPDGIRQELDLGVGFGDGYIQITSQNIGALFLIVPYLLTIQMRADAGKAGSWLVKLALVLSLVTVAVSGRRGLWLVVALTPFIILLLSALTSSYRLMKVGGRRFLIVCAVSSVAVGGVVLALPELPGRSTIGRLQEAVSSQDERSIQKPYLVEGFAEAPVLGSGFGAAARYLRNFERPWTGYELTYYQMLFNLGVVGVVVLGALFVLYFVLVIKLLRRFRNASAIPFSLLVALLTFLLGAYSNRYLGSFDLLFFVGLLPYLSTFRCGFDVPVSTMGPAP